MQIYKNFLSKYKDIHNSYKYMLNTLLKGKNKV